MNTAHSKRLYYAFKKNTSVRRSRSKTRYENSKQSLNNHQIPKSVPIRPKPNQNPRTVKRAETPPTYPFPAYSIVKDHKNKTTGQNLPSRNLADEPNCLPARGWPATRWSEALFPGQDRVNPDGDTKAVLVVD
jgi:hypothetical protein